MFYNRSKSRGESVLGSLFGRYFESKEAAGPQYLLIVPTEKQGGSNGGLGHDQVLWSAFGYREVGKSYVWKVRF